jgi:hypothetical protein
LQKKLLDKFKFAQNPTSHTKVSRSQPIHTLYFYSCLTSNVLKDLWKTKNLKYYLVPLGPRGLRSAVARGKTFGLQKDSRLMTSQRDSGVSSESGKCRFDNLTIDLKELGWELRIKFCVCKCYNDENLLIKNCQTLSRISKFNMKTRFYVISVMFLIWWIFEKWLKYQYWVDHF